MADETLNRDIAECLGWTRRTVQTCIAKPVHKQVVPMDRTTPWQESEQWFPPGKLYSMPLPRYDTDPAACISLLVYTLAQRYQGEPIRVCHVSAEPWAMIVTLHSGLRVWPCEGKTLQEAIARACLAALKAVRKDQTP